VHQVVPQRPPDEIGALFGEREFSRNPADAIGAEKLAFLTHKMFEN
jgi:hypothetical protein